MKYLVCLLGLLAGLTALGQDQRLRNGNFSIYFEPTAVLQSGTEVPFRITVNDALHKPLIGARVTLQIETPEHEHTKVYKATMIENGIYIAKPLFPVAGRWSVYVEVHREDEMSARTIEYYVQK